MVVSRSKLPKRKRSSTPRPASTHKPKSDGGNEIKVKKDSNRVKVFVRVRPFSKDERTRKTNMPYEVTQEATQLHVFTDDKGHAEKTYSFDHVFTMDKNNEEVSGTLTQPLVRAAMNGFNGTLMAYGQTGTGKTHSLMSEDGITKTLIDKCFAQIYEDAKHNYKVTVSYLQIYQEKIFDLLSGVSNSKAELAIRENPRTGVYVDNLSDYVVRKPSEVVQYIADGKKKLVFAETKMNRTSSRSHAVLQMVIERTMKDDYDDTKIDQNESKELNTSEDDGGFDLNAFGKDVIIRGKIHICDLAGSERIKRTGASGDRLNEAQHINSSLLELGNVIQALADESKKHVPFRNSVLTRLLQESLGGNCKTSLIICVSPSPRDLQETKCTLNFGSRAMKVTNTAYVNMEVDFKSLSDQLLKQLQSKEDEVNKMKETLHEEMESERQRITEEYEGSGGKLIVMLDVQKSEFQEEMVSLKEKICSIQNEADTKTREVQEMEEAVFLMDDNSRREKLFLAELFKSEKNLMGDVTTPANKFHQRIANLVRIVQSKMSIFSERNLLIHDAIDFLSSLQEELMSDVNGTRNYDDENETRDLMSRVQLESELNGVYDGLGAGRNIDSLLSGLGKDKEFYSTCLKLFVSNRLQQLQETLTRLEQHNLIETQAREIEEKDEVDAARALKNYTDTGTQAIVLNSIDADTQAIVTNLTDAGTQANVEEKPLAHTGCQVMSPPLVDTSTQANIEKEPIDLTGVQSSLVTPPPCADEARENTSSSNQESHIGSETIEEKQPDQNNHEHETTAELHTKKSHEIFSGFNSTLNRIEDLVKTDRGVSRTPSFNLGGSLSSRSDTMGSLSNRSDSGVYRSNSSLGYNRYEDPYSSKYSSPYTTSFSSGSSNRLNESKYTPRSYGSPMYSSSKYDNNRSYGGSSLNRYNSMDNLLSSERGGFRGSSSDLSGIGFSKDKDEMKKLEDRVKELEGKIKEVQQENQEYVVLVQELSRNVPNEDQLREIKRKVTGKIAETITLGRKENVKVARIEPFSSDSSDSKKSNSINVKYDFTDGKTIIPEIKTEDCDITYDIHVNVVRNIKSPRLPRAASSNLIEFSPDNEQVTDHGTELENNTERPNSLSSAVFGELNKRQTWTDPPKRKNPRPQTWYGGAKTPDVSSNRMRRDSTDSKKLPTDFGRLDVNSYRSEEVVFSKKSSSSLTLPDWMKLKRKSNSNQSNSVIREVIQ